MKVPKPYGTIFFLTKIERNRVEPKAYQEDMTGRWVGIYSIGQLASFFVPGFHYYIIARMACERDRMEPFLRQKSL